MIQISIQEQKDYLKEQLFIESLTANELNKEAIQKFSASKKGKGLEKYLKTQAWKEDNEGSTKVYPVRDKQTHDIVFFFALNAGLLYKELGDREHNLTEQESEIVDLCVEYKLDPNSEYSADDVFEWYEDENIDKEKLRRIIEKETELKRDAEDDKTQTDEGVNIRRVSQTFPSIVLTHFCKNVAMEKYNNLRFPLGFYVFWEIVINKVLEITQLLGCRYLYLFAADNSDHMGNINSVQNVLYDLDEEEVVPTYELVEYYKNELKFQEIQSLAILKPHYDFQCFSLYQPINQLINNRKLSWIQHSDFDE